MIPIKKEKVLVRPKDIKPSSKYLKILGTFNPGAIRLPNGDILLYIRVLERLKKTKDRKYFYSPRLVGDKIYRLKIDKFKRSLVENSSDLDFNFKDGTKRLTFISHMRRVILDKSGFKVKSISKKPDFFGLSWDGELGVEDPRITKIKDLYVMTYVTLSRSENISTSYAISNDCIKWYRRGIIFKGQNKDVVLFPEMVNKKYVAFERPEGNFQFTIPHIWMSYSKDLEFWGRSKSFLFSKKGEWDSWRVGAGPPPIKTKKGWLLIYHGVFDLRSNKIKNSVLEELRGYSSSQRDFNFEDCTVYSAGAALFDLKNPKKLIAKSKLPILFPIKNYEKGTFEYKRVVFPTGLVEDKKGDLIIFSGAGDSYISVKKISLKDVMNSLVEV